MTERRYRSLSVTFEPLVETTKTGQTWASLEIHQTQRGWR